MWFCTGYVRLSCHYHTGFYATLVQTSERQTPEPARSLCDARCRSIALLRVLFVVWSAWRPTNCFHFSEEKSQNCPKEADQLLKHHIKAVKITADRVLSDTSRPLHSLSWDDAVGAEVLSPHINMWSSPQLLHSSTAIMMVPPDSVSWANI